MIALISHLQSRHVAARAKISSYGCSYRRSGHKTLAPPYAPPSLLLPNSESIWCDKMATTTEKDPKKKSQPQLVKLNHAFKLAEHWVNNMSKSSSNDKSSPIELEGRPMRLGIGATVPKESKFTRSSNPVERKLLAKLHNDKRKVTMKDEALAPSAENGNDEDSEEEESESKTRAFAKKRPPSSISHLHARKKHR